MKTAYVLWGTKKEDKDWQEQTIVETTDKQKLEQARAWATANGFNRFRTLTWDGDAPDFVKAVNVCDWTA